MGNVSATCPGSAQHGAARGKRSNSKSACRTDYPPLGLCGCGVFRLPGSGAGTTGPPTAAPIRTPPVHTKRRTGWSSFSSLVFLFWTRRSPKGELSQRGKKSPSGGSSLFQKRENVGGSLRGPAVSAWPSPSGTASSALPAPAWRAAEPPATSPPARPAAAAAASHSPGTGRTPQSTAE